LYQAEGSALTLADLLKIVRRRWWIFVAMLLLVPAAAYLFSARQTKLYTSHVEVSVSSQDYAAAVLGGATNVSKQDPSRNLDTLAQVAKNLPLAAKTLTAAHVSGKSPNKLLAEESVSANPSADVLTFSVTDRSPDAAKALANTWVKEFMDTHTKAQKAAIDAAIGPVENDINQLKSQLAGIAPGKQQPSQRQDMQVLLQRLQDLKNLRSLQGHTLSPVAPASSATLTQPNTKKNLALGVVLGLVLGTVFVFVANALDSRIRTAEEAAAVLGLPLLGRIPAPPAALRKHDKLAMLSDQPEIYSEPYRKLRTNLDFANLTAGARIIMISSALEKEGKTTTAANLAVALARAGRRVVLVDLDLRRPYVHVFFRMEGRAGITDAMLGRASLEEVRVRVPLAGANPPTGPGNHANGNGGGSGGLWIVPAGTIPPDPAEFMSAPALHAALNQLASTAEFVIVDTPPMLPVSDAMTLSIVVDGAVIVVKAGSTRRQVLSELRRLLESSPSTQLGFVLTNAQAGSEYGYSGYGYGYGSKSAPGGASGADAGNAERSERSQTT
jgi:polysaccharide biosynthesis transport protein